MLLEAYNGQFGGILGGQHTVATNTNEISQRMERVMKLTKDFNNMQNYINRLDFVDAINLRDNPQLQQN